MGNVKEMIIDDDKNGLYSFIYVIVFIYVVSRHT
jgi:hypothetical protein